MVIEARSFTSPTRWRRNEEFRLRKGEKLVLPGGRGRRLAARLPGLRRDAGTWFLDGRAPLEVTAVVDEPAGLEVDEHSITICKYPFGLSKFETRWGTFTDPWTLQPQPKCGFVLKGSDGTISSYDYEESVRVQTHDCPEGYQQPVTGWRHPIKTWSSISSHCL